MSPLAPQVVEAALRGLRDLLGRLHVERQQIDAKIVETETALRALEKSGDSNSDTGKSGRRKRGQNLEDVRNTLSLAKRRMTAKQLADEIGIAASSVQATLNNHSGVFEQSPDGLWGLREAVA